MKLSKAQESVMINAKADIDRARSMDYPEWLKATHSYFRDMDNDDDRFQNAISEGYLKEYWENEKNGVVLTHCNSRTLEKLEEMGLIEIIEDSTGETCGIDTVRVLNY